VILYRTCDESWQPIQEETVPSRSKNLSSDADRGFRRAGRNVSVQNRRFDYHGKHQTVPSGKPASGAHSLKRDKELPDRADPVQSTCDKKRRKRLHPSDTVETVAEKLQRTTEDGRRCENDEKPASLSSVDLQKPVNNDVVVAGNLEDFWKAQKPKRPAENLTIGTPFDLALHLDAARKKTRREFDSDSVTVVRQLDEGSRLLHLRPEFNGVETSSCSSADKHVASNVVTSPLSLCCSDVDYAGRLGKLIAEHIEQHVDVKKLEQTAKSLSRRLQRGTATTGEREVVRRQRPVLISTVPRSMPDMRAKVPVQWTNCTPKLPQDQPRAGGVAPKYQQNKIQRPVLVSTVPRSTSDASNKVPAQWTNINTNCTSKLPQNQPQAGRIAPKYQQKKIQQPALITTVPRSMSDIQDKVQWINVSTNSTSKVLQDQPPAGRIAPTYQQKKIQQPALITTVPRSMSDIQDKVQWINVSANSTSKVLQDQPQAGRIAPTYQQKKIQQPALITTVPRYTSDIQDKVQWTNINTNCTSKLPQDQPPAGHIAPTYQQNNIRSPAFVQPRSAANIRHNIQWTDINTNYTPRLPQGQPPSGRIAPIYQQNKIRSSTYVQPYVASAKFDNRPRNVEVGGSQLFRSVDSIESLNVFQPGTSSINGPLKASVDAPSVRRIIASRNVNTPVQSQPQNLSHAGDSRLLMEGNRFAVFH